jgi:hypothetical protein
MQSVTLTGDALTGIGSPDAPMTLLGQLPQTVKLGRIRAKSMGRRLHFGNYFNESLAAPPPTSINRRDKAAASMARMYLNDQYGCCVISGKAHALGLWSTDSDSGGIVQATDAEILSQYHGICGPGDNGCMITAVLDRMKSSGFTAGGKTYKIDGYVAADWTNKLQVKTCQYLFGATSIGINLPQAWADSAVWDVTTSPIVGGHDVTPIDYDEKGVYVSSWGRIYLMTWAAFTSTKWLEEYYVPLSPLWYGNDKLALHGINATVLKDDLAKIGRGEVPSIDAPPPPPAPSSLTVVTAIRYEPDPKTLPVNGTGNIVGTYRVTQRT